MISKIFQGGGVITKDTPLYMLNTPEKLEKYNSIVKKDYEMRKRLEANSTAKNDNLTTFKPVVTETEIELDPKKAALKRAMRTQQRQPEVKVDNPNKASFIADPTRPLVTTINPNANPSNVLSHLNSAINPIQWGKNIVESVKTVINPNTYVNLAKVAIGEQGGDKMKALNDALTIGEGVLGKKGLRLAKKGYVDNTDININLNKIRKEGEKLGLSDWEIKRQQLDKVGITESQREAYVPGVSELIHKNVFPFNYDLSNLNPLKNRKLIKNRSDTRVNQRLDAFGTYLGLPQHHKTLSMSPFTPYRKFHGKIYEDVYNVKEVPITRIDGDINFTPTVGDEIYKKEMDLRTTDKMRYDQLDNISGNTNLTFHPPWKKGQVIGGASSSDRWDLDIPIIIHGKKFILPIEKLIGKPFYTAYSYNAGQGGKYKNLDDINKVD